MYKKYFLGSALIASLLLAACAPKTTTPEPGVEMGETYTSATLTIRKVLTLFTIDALKGVEASKEQLQAKINAHHTLVISDMGCYDGFNSFETIKAIIKRVRELYGTDFKIKVAYSDLAPTPQGFMLELLDKPTLLGENITVNYAPHNIYQPLPYQSDITICSYATHWLSQPISATQPLSSIFPTCFAINSPERIAIDAISTSDIHKFYTARQQDTTVFVACAHMVKHDEHGLQCTAQTVMSLMDTVFAEMYQTHKFTKSSFYIPFAYRTSNQICTSAITAQAKVILENNITMPSVFSSLYAAGKLSLAAVGAWATKEARGWSTGSVQKLVGADLVEEFYHRLEEKIQQDPLHYVSDHHIQVIITSPS